MEKILQKYKNMPKQVRAALWFAICSFMQKGISTITTPIFTRLLSTSDYGQYTVFNSWLGILTVFVSFKMYSGMYTQAIVKYEDDKDVLSSSMHGLNFTLTLFWTIVYLVFHNFWNGVFKLTTVQMLAMLVMIWATAAFNYWATEQRVYLNYIRLVILTIVVSIAKPVIGIVFVILADDKVTARILGLALVEFVGYAGLFVIQLRRGKKFFSKKYWKYALGFSIPLIPHYLSQTILNGADRIMIEEMVDESAAGIYGLAYSLSQIMTLVNQALLQTVNPWIYQKIRDKKTEDIASVGYIALFLIAVANIVLIAFAPEAVAIFAPHEYYDAIWIVPPVAMSVYFTFMYSLFADFEFYYEKKKFIAIATMIGAGANVILNYIFIRRFGYYAAGYTTLFCYILYAVGHYLFMRNICNKELSNPKVYSLGKLLGMSLTFMAVGFGFMLLYNHMIIRYSVITVALVIMVIFYKKIKGLLTQLIGLKKKSND